MKKIRLCAFADEAGSKLSTQIEALNRNGIDLLEIRNVNHKNIADVTAAEAKEIRKQLDDNGISVWSMGSPIGKYSLGEDLAPHIESFKRILENAEILGTSRIRMFSFFPVEGDSAGATEEKVFSALDKLCTIAPKEFILCHENEKEIFGENTENCLKIHRAFPRLRGVFDPANFVQCNVETLSAWNRLCEYIDYIHIKDAAPDGTNVPAGEGMGRLREIIKLYMDKGGEVMTVEPHLAHFVGFSNLENGKEEKRFVYANQNEAFDAAVEALKNILNTI